SSIPENVATMDFFKRAKEEEDVVIGRPKRDRESDEWWLTFSRRFGEAGQKFAGIVAVSVHAGYFVSGYESDALGEHGVLGLVGTDGVFRVRRTGKDISAGTTINYNALVQLKNFIECLLTVHKKLKLTQVLDRCVEKSPREHCLRLGAKSQWIEYKDTGGSQNGQRQTASP
ncbi:MAG: hypothetical protein R6U40_05905, partial [Desulfobacterales bacterium]